MAKSVKINGTTYASVPSVKIPLSTGTGTATFYDTSDATIAAQFVLQGYKGYGPNGAVDGSFTAVSVAQDGTTKALTIS